MYITKNEQTLEALHRFSIIKIDDKPWEVQVVDSIATEGIIEVSLKETYKKIYNLYKEDVPFIGLYRDKNITISAQSLIGAVEPNNYTTFFNIESWYRK